MTSGQSVSSPPLENSSNTFEPFGSTTVAPSRLGQDVGEPITRNDGGDRLAERIGNIAREGCGPERRTADASNGERDGCRFFQLVIDQEDLESSLAVWSHEEDCPLRGPARPQVSASPPRLWCSHIRKRRCVTASRRE